MLQPVIFWLAWAASWLLPNAYRLLLPGQGQELVGWFSPGIYGLLLQWTGRTSARVAYIAAWVILALIFWGMAGARFRPLALIVLCTALAGFGLWTGTLGYEVGIAGLLLCCIGLLAQCLWLCGGPYSLALCGSLLLGYVVTLCAFAVSRIGPALWPEGGSQLAMRYGPWSIAVESTIILLGLVVSLIWADRVSRRRPR
jgi:hypothetical protein